MEIFHVDSRYEFVISSLKFFKDFYLRGADRKERREEGRKGEKKGEEQGKEREYYCPLPTTGLPSECPEWLDWTGTEGRSWGLRPHLPCDAKGSVT